LCGDARLAPSCPLTLINGVWGQWPQRGPGEEPLVFFSLSHPIPDHQGERRARAKDYREITAGIDDYAVKLKALLPETVGAFGQSSRAAYTPSVEDRKT